MADKAQSDYSTATSIAIARARAKAARAATLETTRAVPAYAQDVNRFVAGRRAEEAAALGKRAAERPMSFTDQVLADAAGMMIPGFGFTTPEKTKAAIGEGMSLGLSSPVGAAVDYVSNYLTGAPSQPYGDLLAQRQDEARVRRASAPYSATGAELVSAVGVGGPLARGATSLLAKAAPSAAYSPAGQFVAQGGASALQGAAQSAATGEGDPWTTGILAGVLGGTVGAAFPLTGAAATDAAKREAADRLAGPTMSAALGRESDRPLDVFDLLARRQELGPQATVADLDPLFAVAAEGAMTPRTAAAAAPLIAATSSRTRPIADMLMDDIDAAIGPSYGKVARAEDRAAIIGGARQQYDTALADMRANGFEVDAVALRDQLESAFTKQGVTTSSFKKARDRMIAELDGITGYREPRFNKKGKLVDEGDPGSPYLDVDEALALKKEFDMMVSSRDPSKSVEGEVRATVIDSKNALNDQLKQHPGFAVAAKVYADEFDVQNAEKFASEVFKGNYSADDFVKLYDKMSDLEKQAVARAARDEIQTKFLDKPGGATAFSRRVGPTQDAAFTQKLDKVFGEKAVDKLYTAAMRARAFGETSKVMDLAGKQTVLDTARGVNASSGVGSLADKFTILQQAMQGRATSGATAGAMRRLFVEGKKAANADVQRQVLGYAGKQGEDADAAIMEIMSYLYGTSAPRISSTAGGAVGGGAGALLNALTGPK